MTRANSLRVLFLAILLALAALPANASAYTSELKRYPYLTDVVETSATVNWGTDRSDTTAAVKWGQFGQESCTAHTTAATRTAITVNSVPQYQWKATFTVEPDTQYCYRVFLGTGPEVDLLGTDTTPRFRSQIATGATTPFSFAVFGDWGEVLNSDGTNPNQSNVMTQIAQSGARFALTSGDNAYPNGNQTQYGDLDQTGMDISAVFGPTFWKVPGASIPLFPALGNHGHSNSVHLVNWPQDVATSTSNGRYQTDTYCCLNGTNSANYPSAWYAFDAGNARFYVLDAAWSNSNEGNTDIYDNDYDYHWAPTTAQYQWLANDLATNPRTLKFAFFHFPLYSDNADETSDTFLQGAGSLEGLLNQHGVNMAFNGHAHTYQRNLKPAGGVVSYVTGGGGAHLQPIGQNGCSSTDAYGIGWSNSQSQGSACGAASPPLTKDRVHHFLLVSVNGSTVTVTPKDELGRTFDQVVYTAVSRDMALTKDDSPDPVAPGQTLTYTLTASNVGSGTATGVIVTDNLPAGVTYQSATPSQGTCNHSSGTVSCDLGNVPSGANRTVQIQVTPQSEGSITNNASVTAAETDPNPTNNTSAEGTTVQESSNLSLAKTDTPDPVLRGQTLTYNLTASNAGPSTATGVSLSDTLPAGVTYQSATPSQGSCNQALGTVTCSLGSIASGANATAQIQVTPTAEGAITNTATVSGTQADPNTANNSTNATTTVQAAADLSLGKTDTPDPVLRGQTLTYDLTASNAGPSNATGVSLSDTLPAGVTYQSATPSQGTCNRSGSTVTCALGNMNSGANATVQIRVTPTAEGPITNNASVTATQGDPNTANNSANATTTVEPAANLSLAKTDSPDPVLRGQTLTYNLTATNSGPSNATGVTVTDTLPAGVTYQSANPSKGTCNESAGTVTCALGDMNSGTNATIQIQVTPTAEGPITNNASVTATQGDPNTANNSANATTTVEPAANLSLAKTDSPDPVLRGQTLTYNLTATNNGPSDATGVTVTDTLPSSVTYQSATPSQGTCIQSGRTVTCSLGSVNSGANATVQIQVTPTADGSITNTASVTATQTDPSTANNSASAATTVQTAADMSLAKTDTPDPVLRGQTLTYNLTASNNGPANATGVTVTDALPAGVTYQSASSSKGSCNHSSGVVTCSIGTVNNGVSVTIQIQVTPATDGPITNTASVTATQGDPNTANNTANATTTVDPVANLSLAKTDTPDPVLRGQTLTYNLTASNAGPSTATGVSLSDTLPAGVTYQSATPSQGSCNQALGTVSCTLGSIASSANATVQIQVTPTAEGPIINNASVTATPVDPTPANNNANATTTVQPVTDLSISKTDSPDPVLRGQPLTYRLTVSNTGPSDATGVTVTDELPATVSFESATPSQGSCDQDAGTVTCSLGDVANGASPTVEIAVTPEEESTISNTASVTGAEADPNAANNDASEDTTVVPATDLSVSKTDSPDPALRGQPLTYNLTVSNAGPSDASAVTLTDTLPSSVTYQSATPSQGTCDETSGTVTCDLGAVAQGASPTVSIVVVPGSEGAIVNDASVTGPEADPDSADNVASESTTVQPATDLSVTKTDSPDPVLRGQTLTYDLTVSNAGPSDATGVVVTDDLPATVTFESATPSQGSCDLGFGTVTCTLGTVASGASPTVEIVVTPEEESVITNDATVTGTEVDTDSANNTPSENTTVLPAAADLSLTKSDSPDPVAVTQTLTYTLTATNNGPSRATGVTVTDTLPGNVTYQSATPSQGTCDESGGTVTCDLGTVSNGASPTVDIVVTPDGAGPISNVASVTAVEPDANPLNNGASEGTIVGPAATDLSIVKADSPDPVAQGQLLTYTLTATNSGPSTATGVTVTDTLPASVTYQSATPSQGTCDESGGTVTCDLGTVSNSGNPTIEIVVVPGAEQTITNDASVTATEPDPNAANNAASEDTTVTAVADLSVTQTDSLDPVPAGQAFTYSVTVHNAGPSDGTAVLTDTLPASVFFDSATPSAGSCDRTGATLTCDLGTLASGANATVDIVLRAKRARTLTNTADVSGGATDPNSANNHDTEETTATTTFPPYARPGSATPLRVPLVFAYGECTSPNSEHVLPLDDPSCTPPQAQSARLTMSTLGLGSGFARFQVMPGTAATPDDEADVVVTANAGDVRCVASGPNCTAAGADYTGQLILATSMRVTDLANGPLGADPGTAADAEFSLPITCTATPGATGAVCDVASSAEALVPGWFVEEKRSIVSLLSIRADDAGIDGSVGLPASCPPDCGTGDEGTFLRQGVLAP